MARAELALIWLAFMVPACSSAQSRLAAADTLPPESCVPPPPGRHELAIAAGNDGALKWSTDLSAALSSARAQHKEVLIYFRAKDCADCDRLQAVTLADNYIQMRLGGFALVRLDIEANADAAKSYGINSVPALVRLASTGAVSAKHSGFLNKDELLEFLRRHPER